jgi:hypothetical protein
VPLTEDGRLKALQNVIKKKYKINSYLKLRRNNKWERKYL